MALKISYDTKEDIPAEFISLFTEKDERWELTGIEGLKTQADIDRINNALRKERNDHKAAKEKLKQLGDRSIEEVIEQLDRIPELEAQIEATGSDPKKIDAVVEARIKSRIAPVERERDGLKTKVGQLEGELTTSKMERKTRAIHDAIRDAAGKAKLLPEAMEDALMLAERVFDINEDNKVVVKDGANGFTPGIDPIVWFSDIQKKRSHWWGPSTGGGAGGSRGGNGGIKNPWQSDNWNMTEQGQLYQEDPSRASQMAAAAGTTIGGPRPQPRK